MFLSILGVLLSAFGPNPPRDFMNQHLVFARVQGLDSLLVTLSFGDVAVGHGYPVLISLEWKGDGCNATVNSLQSVLTLAGPRRWSAVTEQPRNAPQPCILHLTLHEDEHGKLWLSVSEEDCSSHHPPRCKWEGQGLRQVL